MKGAAAMLRRFFIKCIVCLIIFALCLPIIKDVLDSFDREFTSIGYQMGVDLDFRRLIRDPMGAINEIFDSALNFDSLLNSIGQ